jgi:hypothetical protein
VSEKIDGWKLADALVVADDAGGYPLDVLMARLEILADYPAIQAQIIAEIKRREKAAPP